MIHKESPILRTLQQSSFDMWWQYILVFLVLFLVDVAPVPLPPAFTVMILLQVEYDLNIWAVVAFGVAGSIAGRYILTLYIQNLSGKIFKQAKNEEVEFLGNKIKSKGWKGQLFILIYTLMPLPSTPLFIAGGMAKLTPIYIIPAFAVGKISSDLAVVSMGDYAEKNSGSLVDDLTSPNGILGLTGGLLLILAFVFIDWRTLLMKKKLTLKFKIFK